MGVGALQRPAWLQSAYGRQPPGPAHFEIVVFTGEDRLGADGYGNVESMPNVDAGKAGRSYTDYFYRLGIQRKVRTDRRRRTSKFALPKSITDDRYGSTPAPVIVRGNNAAQQRTHSERAKVIAGHPDAVGRPRSAAFRQIELRIAPGEDAGERLLMVADLLPDRVGHARIAIREVPAATFSG